MKRLLIALSLALCAAVAVPAVGAQYDTDVGTGDRPGVVVLPLGFAPEGITTGKRSSFFVGSIPTGDIYGGSLRTGRGEIVVDAPAGRSAIGIKIDRRNRIFVAGGNTSGNAKGIWVYDAETGGEVRSYPIPDAGFINDVVLTKRAAYFTDSQVQRFYKVPIGRDGALGELQTIAITGEFVYSPGFNANGIAAAKGGRVLIMVKSSTGELFTVDPRTGASREIAYSGGDGELDEGDGLLLKGRRLYVVENQDNRVSVVKLRRDLSEGRIVREIDSDRFNVPTTIARSGGRFYVVNAKFGQNTPDQTYEVVKVPKR
jgi:hypothetical protein